MPKNSIGGEDYGRKFQRPELQYNKINNKRQKSTFLPKQAGNF